MTVRKVVTHTVTVASGDAVFVEPNDWLRSGRVWMKILRKDGTTLTVRLERWYERIWHWARYR